jgi:hypothetical protein
LWCQRALKFALKHKIRDNNSNKNNTIDDKRKMFFEKSITLPVPFFALANISRPVSATKGFFRSKASAEKKKIVNDVAFCSNKKKKKKKGSWCAVVTQFSLIKHTWNRLLLDG